MLAGLGAWGGATYVMRTMHAETPLHELVHEKLDLSAEQKTQAMASIDALRAPAASRLPG